MKKLKLSDIYNIKIFHNSFNIIEVLIMIIYLLITFFIKR